MADIEFRVPTRRTVAQVKSTIDAEIASRLPGGRIKRYWEGDVFRLVGMGADGRIEVGAGEIRASVDLRAPLSFMKGKVEQGLRETVERAAAGTDGGASTSTPAPAAPMDSAAADVDADVLRARVDGVVLPGATAHDEFLSNFGHIHQWRPALVVKPTSKDDVLQALAFAKEKGLTVSTRGAAHSQS